MVEVKIPSPGESITEVELAAWTVANGDFVERDQEIGEIESDKATLPLIAEESGQINIDVKEGETVKVGDIVARIDTSKKAPSQNGSAKAEKKPEAPKKEEKQPEKPKETQEKQAPKAESTPKEGYTDVKVSPVAQKMMAEHNLNIEDIIKGLQRIGKEEVNLVLGQKSKPGTSMPQPLEASREVDRAKMSQLRKKLSQRLVAVKNETAMLTTFNEADMTAIMEMRKAVQKQFIEKHNIKLGFMSFFTKAASIALRHHPKVNSQIDGDEIINPKYTDIGIAVQTDKGLMVPVLRNVETLAIPEIEKQIAELAKKARSSKISMEEMTGGTFTITNGGVFGSMMSTPIINPPQSAILGMHNIIERPVALNGQVVIRPMMYLALSYDHRIIDGRDSVSFLVKLKQLIENPHLMLQDGHTTEKLLFEL